ncbi:MAG: AAA family ATPase [Bacilli bacterium]|nr:AAA family ATPase [Bacilli bacterium]
MSKMYAMLMERVAIDDMFYIFKPIDKIEGYLQKYNEFSMFQTGEANAYYLADDIISLDSDYRFVAHNIISEEDLLELYDTNDIEEALANYVNDNFEKTFFGLTTFEDGKIAMSEIETDDLISKIYNRCETSYNDVAYTFNSDNLNIEVTLEDDIFDDYISSKYLKESFDNACTSIKIVNDYTEMIELLEDITDFYNSLSTRFKKEEPKELSSFFMKIAELFKKLSLFKTTDEIKEKFFSVFDELNEANNIVVRKYEEFENKNAALTVVEKEEKSKMINVKEMKEKFDQVIIGQEDAKKAVIKAIFKNRVRDNIESSNKNNCLLIGPTGCGKTLIAEVAAKYFNLPLDIVDSPQITAAGYIGANITDCLEHLLSQTKGNLKEAEKGIIVFDELDKKGQLGSGVKSDVNKGDVLNEMLKFIEGSKYDVTYNNKNYVFDTSNLSIIGMGSFAAAQEDMNQNEIGFNKKQNEIEEDIKYKKMTTDDFSKKANIPRELVGRFTIKKQLSGHTIESLRRILTESKSSALLSEKDILNCLDIELSWTDDFLDEVAKKAVKLKTGARSLKSTIEEAIEEAEWEVLCNLDTYKGIILTDKSVNDNTDILLIDVNDNKHNLKDIIASKDKTSLSVQKELVYKK